MDPEIPVAPKQRAQAAKLPLGQSLAYGTGQMAHQVFDSGIGYLAFYVFNIALGVSPVLVGLAQSISRGVDLFTDPLAGYLADSSHGRFGRRAMIAAGSLVGGFFFALIWLFPPGLSPTAYFLWLLVCFCVTSVGWSFCSVPRQAIGIEMTTDSYQRTKLMAIASFMAMLCNLGMAWSYAATQLPLFGGTVNGARWVGGAMGAVIVVFGLTSAAFCKERPAGVQLALAQSDKGRVAGLKDFKVAIQRVGRSRPFLLLVGAVALVIIGVISTSYGVDPCIAISFICGGSQPKAAIILGGGSTAWITTGLAVTPLILWLSKRFGKKRILSAFLCVALLGTAMKWICYNPAWPWLFVIPHAMFGAGIAAIAALAPSMTADACDVEESVSGARDSGMFSAFYNWTIKLGISLGIAVTGVLLNVAGFHASGSMVQDPRTILNMRLIDIGVPAALISVALFLVARYPITDRQMERVRLELGRQG